MKTNCLHLVLTLRILAMCRAHTSLHGKLTHKLPAKTALVLIALSLHILSLSHTTFTNKAHMKYRVHKIEQNYNQIWHGIKANKDIVVNYNFTIPKTHARCFQPLHHKPYVEDIIDILDQCDRPKLTPACTSSLGFSHLYILMLRFIITQVNVLHSYIIKM